MARWITKTVGGAEMLRAREGEQFEWAGIIYPSDFAAVLDDAQIEALGFAVAYTEDVAQAAPGAPLIVSRLQFFRALAKRFLITPAEAMAAITVGAIPAALQTAIDALPEPERFDAAMIVAGAPEFDSRQPLTETLALKLMAAGEIPGFFAFARTL